MPVIHCARRRIARLLECIENPESHLISPRSPRYGRRSPALPTTPAPLARRTTPPRIQEPQHAAQRLLTWSNDHPPRVPVEDIDREGQGRRPRKWLHLGIRPWHWLSVQPDRGGGLPLPIHVRILTEHDGESTHTIAAFKMRFTCSLAWPTNLAPQRAPSMYLV